MNKTLVDTNFRRVYNRDSPSKKLNQSFFQKPDPHSTSDQRFSTPKLTNLFKFQKEDKEEEILKEAEHQKDSALESNTSDKDKESDTEQEQVATRDEEKSGEQNATRVPRNGDDVSDGKATQKDRLGLGIV